ncbi:MAG: TonB-dependent receptor [Candidatus Manganitrophaceae bacterium]
MTHRTTRKTIFAIGFALLTTFMPFEEGRGQENRKEKTQDTVVTLGEVTVTGKKSGPLESADLLTSVDIIGADQLERENVDETMKVMKKVPGVYMSEFNQGIISGDIGIRGFSPEGDNPHTKLLIDGIPSNLNSGFADMKPIFPLEIDRIEVVKGTIDPRYGLHNIAGNVNIFTRRGGNDKIGKMLYGSFGTLDLQALSAFEKDRLSQTYFASYRRSDGYRDHSGLDKYALSGKWFYRLTDRLSVGLIARASEFDADAPGYLTREAARTRPTDSPGFSSTDGGTQSNRHASLHLEYEPNPRLFWSFKTYGQSFERHRWVRFTAAGAQQERVEDEKQIGALSEWTFRPGDGEGKDLAFSWGIDYQFQDNLHERFRTVDRSRTGLVLRRHDFTFFNYGAYAQADGKPAGWLRLTGGLRWDRVGGSFTDALTGTDRESHDYGNIWQPKIGIVVTPVSGYNLYGNWGRSFQVGAGAGAFKVSADESLGVSKNDGWETGVKISPAAWLLVRIAYWRQTATDEVRLKFDNSGDSENVGETRRAGWDLEFAVAPHEMIYLWGAYTRQKATLVEPGPTQPLVKGNDLDHVPGFTLKAGVDVTPIDRLTASLWWYMQGDYHLTTANNLEQFGDYALANLDLLYRIGPVALGAHIKNLFNKYYEYVWFDGTTTLHSPGEARGYYATVTAYF